MSEYKKLVAKNKRASFEYYIEETLEAGIVLTGSEVKSIRGGKVNIADSHAAVDNNELFLHNSHIAEYKEANRFNHEPGRIRKLLIKKKELKKIFGKIHLKGYTLVALSMYFNKDNRIKIELAVAKGKKQHDKRQSIKENDWKRQQGRLMRNKM